jgi:hypothetical protein
MKNEINMLYYHTNIIQRNENSMYHTIPKQCFSLIRMNLFHKFHSQECNHS